MLLKDKRFRRDEGNTCCLVLRYSEEITEFSVGCLEFEHFGEIVEFFHWITWKVLEE